MDGIEQEAPAPVLPQQARDDQATTFIKATQADIRHGGDMAFYRPADDFIRLPDTTTFESYVPRYGST
jgi:antirestriction protein ArdC